MFHTKNLAILLVCVALFAGSGGCAFLERNPAMADAAISYATQTYIEKSNDPARRAARVVEVAELALEVAGGGNTTVNAVRVAVMNALPADLTPPERTLAEGLVDAVAQELASRVSAGTLEGDALVTTRAVLLTVIEAARVYETT